MGQLGGTLRRQGLSGARSHGRYPGRRLPEPSVPNGSHPLGYAYDISANWGANYDHPGLFEIAGSTKSASTAQTPFKVFQQEVEKMRTAESPPKNSRPQNRPW